MAYVAYVKDPNAVLDYQVNWATWLGADTILTSTWIVDTGITNSGESNTTTTATIWLSGGTAGDKYGVTNRITTAAGRTDDRTFYISVESR